MSGAPRIKLRIALGAVAVLLGGAALRGWDLARRHGELIAGGEGRATNLALLLSGYLRESFAATDASLRQLALHSRRIGGPAASDSDWLPSLRSAGAGHNALGAVSVWRRGSRATGPASQWSTPRAIRRTSSRIVPRSGRTHV